MRTELVADSNLSITYNEDGTIASFTTAAGVVALAPVGSKRDPLTGGIEFSVGGASLNATLRRKIALAGKPPGAAGVFTIMASPPTTAATTTNPLSSGVLYASTTEEPDGTIVANNRFTYTKAGAPYVSGIYGNANYIRFGSVTYNTGRSDNTAAVSVIYDGTRIVFWVSGNGSQYLVKIDDKYVSLTPIEIPSDGEQYFIDIPLGSRAIRRIELIGANMRFGGVFTAATETIWPAPIRGPRVIVQGDSFTEGTGAPSYTLGYVQAFADAMGWDDVWSSGVGARGYVAAPDGKLTCGQALPTDVIPFTPDIVINTNGINDNGQAGVSAAVGAYIAAVKSGLPNAFLILVPAFSNKGGGFNGAGILAVHAAIVDSALNASVHVADLIEMPIKAAPHVSSILSSISAAATSLETPVKLNIGSTYKFANGDRFVPKSQSGAPNTVTVDYVQSAHSAGETITECGSSFLTGSGLVSATTGNGNCDVYVGGVAGTDPTHPTQLGHKAIGIALAAAVSDILKI